MSRYDSKINNNSDSKSGEEPYFTCSGNSNCQGFCKGSCKWNCGSGCSGVCFVGAYKLLSVSEKDNVRSK